MFFTISPTREITVVVYCGTGKYTHCPLKFQIHSESRFFQTDKKIQLCLEK